MESEVLKHISGEFKSYLDEKKNIARNQNYVDLWSMKPWQAGTTTLLLVSIPAFFFLILKFPSFLIYPKTLDHPITRVRPITLVVLGCYLIGLAILLSSFFVSERAKKKLLPAFNTLVSDKAKEIQMNYDKDFLNQVFILLDQEIKLIEHRWKPLSELLKNLGNIFLGLGLLLGIRPLSSYKISEEPPSDIVFFIALVGVTALTIYCIVEIFIRRKILDYQEILKLLAFSK